MTEGIMSLQPLTAALRAAQDSGVTLGVLPGLRADDDPAWQRLDEDFIVAGVRATAAHYGAPEHVGAALWWKAYAYWATLPVAVGWALNRRVPLMSRDRVVVRAEAGGLSTAVALRPVAAAVTADDPCAGGPGTVVADGERGLLALLRESLLESNLAWVISVLNTQTRMGARNLWGSVAESLAHPLIAYGETLTGRDGGAAAAELLDAIGGPVAGLVELLPGEPRLRRRTCCLWVTLGEPACSTCCVLR